MKIISDWTFDERIISLRACLVVSNIVFLNSFMIFLGNKYSDW